MIRIDDLRLRLPPGYQGRAEGIAHALAEALAPLAAGLGPLDITHLPIKAVRISPAASDNDIGRQLAQEVARALEAQGR